MSKEAKFAAVILAAGKSSRCRIVDASGRRPDGLAGKKPFAQLMNRSVWLYSLRRFVERDDVVQTILVVAAEDRAEVERTFRDELERFNVALVEGGAERFLSVENALRVVDESVDYVAVHDAARPCLSASDLDRVFCEATRTGAAILATPVVGSLKRAKEIDDRSFVDSSVSRAALWEAQTPQVFSREILTRAYRERAKNAAPTDDCELAQALGVDVAIVSGERFNIKITSEDDLELASLFLSRR